MEPLSRTERAALCNTALEHGPESPTLCGEWTVRDLVVHLLVRERDPIGAPGILVPGLGGLADRAARRLSDQDFTALVERVRGGPPLWSPLRPAPVDRAVNGLEFFVHHEDIRRARPQWQPRELTDREQKQVWTLLGYAGKGLVRPAGVPVELVWPAAGTPQSSRRERRTTLRRGPDPVVVTGQPSELAMFLYSREQHHDLTLDGPPAAVAALQDGRFAL